MIALYYYSSSIQNQPTASKFQIPVSFEINTPNSSTLKRSQIIPKLAVSISKDLVSQNQQNLKLQGRRATPNWLFPRAVIGYPITDSQIASQLAISHDLSHGL